MNDSQESSLSAPSDFTENMTMYMAEDFDIARWRQERKSNKQNNKKERMKSASTVGNETNAANTVANIQSGEGKADVMTEKAPAEDAGDEDKESSLSSASSHKSSSRHPTSTLDLPGFAWPVSADATQEDPTSKSQQMLTQLQDLQFQVEQTSSENVLLKAENNKFRVEISDLRSQFAELAEQLAEFQIEYDSLQKERHAIAKVLMQEWGMKEAGKVKNAAGRDGVGFKYT